MTVTHARSRITFFSRAILFLAATTITCQAWAGTYYVSVNGNDDNPGSLAQPYRTIKHALAKLRPGDTLYLRAGTYYEQPRVTVSGTAGQPITISGYAGEQAVIDSGLPEFRAAGNSDWELVNASLGEYRSKTSCRDGDNIYAYVTGIAGYDNERVALIPYSDINHFRASTDSYAGGGSKFYVGPGTMEIAGRCHIRLAKTSAMRNAEARYGKVFASENANPAAYSIVMSQASATLKVKGAHLTFKNLTVNQARNTILLEAGAQHVRFDGITAWMGKSTVQTYSGPVHHITITNSRILGDSPYWIFWSDMKNAPAVANRSRGTSIDLLGGTHDWLISRNLIRGSGQDLIGTNNGEDRIFVHHNRMENCGDDAFEIEGKAAYGGRDDIGLIQIHDNYISNCLVAISVGQDTRKMTGPLLFYRNVVALLRDHPVNRKVGINHWNGGGQFGYGKMFKQVGSGFAARNVHFYHNTLAMLNAHGGIEPTPEHPDGSTFANNIVAMVNDQAVAKYKIGANQVIDGNLYWKANALDGEHLVSGKDSVAELDNIEQRSISAVPNSGSDPQFADFSPQGSTSNWALRANAEVLEPANFMLSGSSPARGKAVALSCRGVSGTDEQGRPLCNNGKLPDSHTAADIGAIPVQAQVSDYRVFPYSYALTPDPIAASAPKVVARPTAPVLKLNPAP